MKHIGIGVGIASVAMLGSLAPGLTSGECLAAERFTATITALNADKIGTSASGTANLEEANGKLTVTIDLKGLPPGLMHMQHYHGFPDGKDATCPSAAADTNKDGYIDLLEAEASAGTTMVPFHKHPATLEIANDTYPVADKDGAAHYQNTEVVAHLGRALENKFKEPVLPLDKRVILIHGVATDAAVPDTVKSLPGVPAQMTLPIACGKIEPVK